MQKTTKKNKNRPNTILRPYVIIPVRYWSYTYERSRIWMIANSRSGSCCGVQSQPEVVHDLLSNNSRDSIGSSLLLTHFNIPCASIPKHELPSQEHKYWQISGILRIHHANKACQNLRYLAKTGITRIGSAVGISNGDPINSAREKPDQHSSNT